MVGILVHGDNHFIVRGPRPNFATAMELARHWSVIQIGARTPPHLAGWSISTREFREDLEWAIVVPGEGERNPAVAQLLDELRARGISVMNANHDLLTTMYRAFNARNLDEILPVLHPEVDWPNGMEGGRVFGREGVREYWTRQWKMIDPHVEPVGFEDVDGRTAVNVHQTVRDLSGNVLADQMVRHVYEIRDGLVVSMEIVPGG